MYGCYAGREIPTEFRMKVVLEDIDGVSFPFKEQYLKFIREKYSLSNELLESFESSDYTFLHEYLLNGAEKRYLKEIDKLEGEDNSIINFTKRTISEFGESPYFLRGIDGNVKELNKGLKDRDVKVIGLTARCCDLRELNIYRNPREKTWEWNEAEKAGLDEIYYINTEDKHRIMDYLDNEVVCMVEDHPKSVEGFLERGIKCVLINKGQDHLKEHMYKLKEKYEDLLLIAEDSLEAKNIVKELV